MASRRITTAQLDERAKTAANEAAFPYSKSRTCNAVRIAVCHAIGVLPAHKENKPNGGDPC